ncbi:3-oxoadipate CoA-transferase subunit A [Geodia barretti]|uniref:3-oxoadipate CoA-transferase subunit A n=2 Tax=Geodia barretti TaxID=519541 RepID=A0AA35SBM4_GEOBA|nr:3-oxoadipate CoA-transferase subunit A [Geodia barretti]
MKNKTFPDFDAAVADVPDGATIMFGDFGGIGAPQNLIAALHRKGTRGLTGISNEHGGTDGRVDVGTLIEAGRIRKMVCSITAATHPSRVTPFVRLYNAGAIDGELVPQGTLAERIRAGGAGIGGFYTPTGAGTEIAAGKESREISGRSYLLEYPLVADYAFIRAWQADAFGNLRFRMAQRNFNPIMAMAARVTLVEVENAVVPIGTLDPDDIHLPGVYVDRIVEIPSENLFI